jgi:hypothetical protein
MQKKKICFLVTQEEYEGLREESEEDGMKFSYYCRQKLCGDNYDFPNHYKKLLQFVDDLQPNNCKFTIKELWNADEWNIIPLGIKIALGKQFFKDVDQKKIPNVDKAGLAPGGTARYIKKI